MFGLACFGLGRVLDDYGESRPDVFTILMVGYLDDTAGGKEQENGSHTVLELRRFGG
jgi:hypothetical protein